MLSGELELAARPGRSREELAAAVARAGEEVARLIRITDQLLFLARSDEDRITPRLEPIRFGSLLARSAEQAAGRAHGAGVRCRVEAPAGLIADVDADRLREAIDNLVDNALRFAPPEPTSCSRPGRSAPIWRSRSAMPGRAFRPSSCRTPSSGSPARIRRTGPRRRRRRVWAWPS